MILPSRRCAADQVKEIRREKIFIRIQIVFDPTHNLVENDELRRVRESPRRLHCVSVRDARAHLYKLTQGEKAKWFVVHCLYLSSRYQRRIYHEI